MRTFLCLVDTVDTCCGRVLQRTNSIYISTYEIGPSNYAGRRLESSALRSWPADPGTLAVQLQDVPRPEGDTLSVGFRELEVHGVGVLAPGYREGSPFTLALCSVPSFSQSDEVCLHLLYPIYQYKH